MSKFKLKVIILICLVILFFISYNNKQVNCLIENNLPTKFVGIPSTTWLRFTHKNYNFSFTYPACWDIDVQSESGLDFITVSKWIRGNLYSITMFQSNFPNANQSQDVKTVTVGKGKIKAFYSEVPNDFTGSSGGNVTHVGKGYDKVYSFQVDKEKYLSVQYIYEQSVNGKKYTEPEIGRVVADKLVQSMIIETSPILKSISMYCPKCIR
jgi:hypothetical protein